MLMPGGFQLVVGGVLERQQRVDGIRQPYATLRSTHARPAASTVSAVSG